MTEPFGQRHLELPIGNSSMSAKPERSEQHSHLNLVADGSPPDDIALPAARGRPRRRNPPSSDAAADRWSQAPVRAPPPDLGCRAGGRPGNCRLVRRILVDGWPLHGFDGRRLRLRPQHDACRQGAWAIWRRFRSPITSACARRSHRDHRRWRLPVGRGIGPRKVASQEATVAQNRSSDCREQGRRRTGPSPARFRRGGQGSRRRRTNPSAKHWHRRTSRAIRRSRPRRPTATRRAPRLPVHRPHWPPRKPTLK